MGLPVTVPHSADLPFLPKGNSHAKELLSSRSPASVHYFDNRHLGFLVCQLASWAPGLEPSLYLRSDSFFHKEKRQEPLGIISRSLTLEMCHREQGGAVGDPPRGTGPAGSRITPGGAGRGRPMAALAEERAGVEVR